MDASNMYFIESNSEDCDNSIKQLIFHLMFEYGIIL